MQDNEYEYAEYEAVNEREDDARARRERDDETNPLIIALNGWIAGQTWTARASNNKGRNA